MVGLVGEEGQWTCLIKDVEYDGRREPYWNRGSVAFAQQRQVAILCGVEAVRGTGLIEEEEDSFRISEV